MGPKKVYVHFEDGLSITPFTKTLYVNEDDTALQVAKKFVDEFNKSKDNSDKPLSIQNVSLQVGEGGTALKPSDNLYDLCDEKDDVFVRENSPSEVQAPEPFVASGDPAPVDPASVKVEQAAPPSPTNDSFDDIAEIPSTSPYSKDEVKLIREHAQSLFDTRQYRAAKEVLQHAATTVGTRDLLELLSSIYREAGRHQEALVYAQKAIEAFDYPTKHPRTLLVLAKAHSKLKNYSEAIESLKTIAANPVFKTKVKSTFYYDVYTEFARNVFLLGLHSDAVDIINALMHYPKAHEHIGTLLLYAEMGLTYNKIEEASQAILKAILLDEKNRQARKLVADVLASESGFNTLMSQIKPSAQSVVAYGYLAAITKEFAKFTVSIQLLQLAIKYDPNRPVYYSNLAHVYEAMLTSELAMAQIVEFLRTHPDRTVGGAVCGMKCDAFYEVLNMPLEEVRCSEYLVWEKSLTCDEEYARVLSILGRPTEKIEEITEENLFVKEEFDEFTLEVLAMLMTAVKLLYLDNRLPVLLRLVRRIEKIRRLSLTPLHMTFIRNEHAYYLCILHVLHARAQIHVSSLGGTRILSDPYRSHLYDQAASRPIYVCGDSHAVPPAWGILFESSTPRLLIPRIVTGLKHWHLRDECTFFTKEIFRRVIQRIPTESTVIFMFGEIDCREGMLLAVERYYYDTLHDAMMTTIGCFVSTLKKVLAKKKFKVH